MGSGSATTAFGKGRSQTNDRVRIPEFLRPFLEQGTDVAGGALSTLQGQLRGAQGDDLVAGFTPAQQLAQGIGTNRALGEGGFFDTAQNEFLGTAQGRGLEDILDPQALQALQGAAGGQGLDFLDPQALETLRAGAQGGDVQGLDRLAQLSQQSAVPQQTLDTLQQTAGGDFLAGGQGFDEAVEAAVRAARPGVLSTFGRAGAGGATGGLSQAAIGQSAVDAFARQFAQERQNQLGAADQLAQLGLADRGQTADISQALAGLDLSQGNQRLGAAESLAGFGGQERGRQLNAAGLLSDLGFDERSNQLAAAGFLPDIAEADINLLSGIGGQQQEQEQARLTAPIDAQLQLLSAALGGVPLESLLGGRRTTSKYRTFDQSFTGGGGVPGTS